MIKPNPFIDDKLGLKASIVKCCCFFILIGQCILFADAGVESNYYKAIQAHLKIKDYPSAIQESVEALHQYPHHQALWEIYIKALGKSGNEKEMILTWKDYTDVFPEKKSDRDLIEVISWSVLENASQSSSPIIRILAILSAFFSQDSRGIEILNQSLTDKSSIIRGAAVQLAGQLKDDSIGESIYKLFKQETVWAVRQEVIDAIGHMRLKKAYPDLIEQLQNPRVTAEETSSLIGAIVEIQDSSSREDIFKLARSNRAGLRLLACELVAHFKMKDEADIIAELTEDYNATVRADALWTLGQLRVKTIKNRTINEIALAKLNDMDPYVKMRAAWVITLNDALTGQKLLTPWLTHENRDVRICASGYLASCGKYAMPALLNEFKQAKDPVVRMNLALGLIGQRVEVQNACFALFNGLSQTKERLNWNDNQHHQILTLSKLKHAEALNHSPETIDQITRLEILNILAMMNFSYSQQAIKNFLKEKSWGITSMAAATLLTEGDEQSLDIVEKLMQDSDVEIRTQAALILALWGGGDQALDTLSETYLEADHETKERILEGIVRIASPKSIPFLVERLHEPNQSLRVMAAAGLILCLYH